MTDHLDLESVRIGPMLIHPVQRDHRVMPDCWRGICQTEEHHAWFVESSEREVCVASAEDHLNRFHCTERGCDNPSEVDSMCPSCAADAVDDAHRALETTRITHSVRTVA